MNIKELKIKENISVRTINVCEDNKLFSIQQIIEYYVNYRNFKRLRNCGDKTNLELIHICEKYIKQNNEFKSENILTTKIAAYHNTLEDPLKLQKLQIASNDIFNHLSNRAKNTILLNANLKSFNIETIIYKLVAPKIDFKDLQNCGSKTEVEIKWFVDRILEIIKVLDATDLNEEDVILTQLEKSLGHFEFHKKSTLLELIKSKELNIIYFVEKYIFNSVLFNVNDKEILRIYLDRSDGTEVSKLFIKAARNLNITKERVRQLFVKFKTKGVNKLSFLHLLLNYSFDLGSKTKNQTWKIHSQPLGEQFKLLECRNNEQTLANLLDLLVNDNSYYILSENIKLKGKIAAYDQKAYKKYRFLKIKYLIQESFLPRATFLKICEDLYLTIIDRIPHDTYFKFSDYNLNDEQKKFVIEVCAENFGLNISNSHELILKRNTVLTAPDIIADILYDIDELMTAEEILEEYRIRFPHVNKEITSLRGALNNDRFIFFRGSGSSRYGLKEWEHEKGLKAGNIKAMCQEYIECENLPVHIFSLTQYIQRHRDTNQKNVLTNLKLDNKGLFRFFAGGFIGLTGMDYPVEITSKYRSVNPYDANMICYFIKNHWYYDYNKTISKFCDELGLMSPQVENLINQKTNEGILKIKNGKLYYNQVDEDSIYERVFENFGCKKDYDFNPYRIEIDNWKVICKISVLHENHFLLTEKSFSFTRYDLDTTDCRCLMYYQKSHKSFKVIIWRNDEIIDQLIGHKFYFSDENNFENEELFRNAKIISFTYEKINSFKLELLNILNGTTRNEVSYDLSQYHINGLNKMHAISKIIELTESKYNKLIDLTEAKRIYEMINGY